MTIDFTENGSALNIALDGRLDTTTSPQLEDFLKSRLAGKTEVTFDFAGLKYISSAGLRILLGAQKIMSRQGQMTVCHVNDEIAEIFDITGFSDILTIL